jgi:hypothetical protein
LLINSRAILCPTAAILMSFCSFRTWLARCLPADPQLQIFSRSKEFETGIIIRASALTAEPSIWCFTQGFEHWRCIFGGRYCLDGEAMQRAKSISIVPCISAPHWQVNCDGRVGMARHNGSGMSASHLVSAPALGTCQLAIQPCLDS